LTCAAIVRNSLWRGVEADDRKRTWMDDASSCLVRSSVETARAVYAHALGVFPTKKGLWKAACDLERKHGTSDTLDAMLATATKQCPQAEILWLIWAKEKWQTKGDVAGAREVLVEAFKANPDSEDIWLAAAKLEWESDEFERARILLKKACERAPSPKVWMKLALLEREVGLLGNATSSGSGSDSGSSAELATLDEAVKQFPTFEKLYMMAGQACERQQLFEKARGYYQAGLRRCPSCVSLWKLAATLEQRFFAATSASTGSSEVAGGGGGGGVVKGRSMLELARLKNPKNDQLWVAAVRLEAKAGNEKMAQTLMAKALQECPDSGPLWAEDIKTAARAARRGKSMEALKRCDNDPAVICAVAGLFVDERKVPKARKWFDRAVKIDEAQGDTWAQYYAFELEHGTEDTQRDVLQRCVAAEPKYGEVWCSVSKDPVNRKMPKDKVLARVAAAFNVA
jgi:pre-mRNA-processing factor 6